MPTQTKRGHARRTSEPEAPSQALPLERKRGQAKSAEIPDGLKNFSQLPDEAIVKQPVVEVLFSISSTTVWRWVNSKRLPMPRRIGARSIGWNVGELRKVLKGESNDG